MTYFVSPVIAHSAEAPKPPGITVTDWAYLVSTVDLPDLEAIVTTIGAGTENIRTPALGSLVTYIALDATQRTAALAAGALEGPTEKKTRIKAFDATPTSPGWEP